MELNYLQIAILVLASLLVLFYLPVFGSVAAGATVAGVRFITMLVLLGLYVSTVFVLITYRYAPPHNAATYVVIVIAGLALYIVPRWIRRREMKSSPRLMRVIRGLPPYDVGENFLVRSTVMVLFALYVAAIAVALVYGPIALLGHLGIFN